MPATALECKPEPMPPEDRFRPRWHFAPQRNWINDPNGLIWIDGRWHMFYQYNPHGNIWGHMSWGHASSVDLVQWDEHGVALPEDAAHWIFSGSAIFDAHNVSGLGTPENPPFLAFYTGAGKVPGSRQVQCLAYSLDRGRSWHKYAGNPVLDEGMEDFRDPKLVWHAPTSSWIMVIARSKEDRLSFYRSADLLSWTHLSDFGPAGAIGHLWECPDLFALPVDGGAGESRWVLKVDFCHGDDGRGCSGQAFFGQFDGTRFHPDCDADGLPIWQRLDEGPDFYAAMSWHGGPPGDARRIWTGWMSDHAYSGRTPTGAWRGMMSVPRSVSLRRMGDRFVLVQQPVAELDAIVPAQRWSGAPQRVAGGAGRFAITLADADGANGPDRVVNLRWGDAAALSFAWHRAENRLSLDRANSGALCDDAAFRRVAVADRIGSGPLALDLLVDGCALEIYVDGGVQVFAAQMFPPPGDPLLTLDVPG